MDNKNNSQQYTEAELLETAGNLGVDPESLRMLRTSFKKNAPDQLDTMRKLHSGNEVTALSKAAHKMKGAAANLRFNALAELLQSVEKKSIANELDNPDAVFNDIQHEIEKIPY